MTPPTDDEKRFVVARFNELDTAINAGAADVDARFSAFRRVYTGNSSAIVDGFVNLRGSAEHKRWAWLVKVKLGDEIDENFWPRKI